MAVFRVTAWMTNPDGIPHSSELLLPDDDVVAIDADPDRAERLALGLTHFLIQIHITVCIDYHCPQPQPSLPPVDGDVNS